MMLKNKDDELYNFWVKLKTLTLDDSQETKDSKDVSKLQAADAVDKSHEAKHLKGSSKLNALTVDDGQDLKSISNSKHDATAKSHEKAQEVFRQALVLPKHVTCKKTLVSYQHVSSDEAIAQMEDKAEASCRRTEKEM